MSYQSQGEAPYVIDIKTLTKDNANFRTAVWTGEHLQLTVMSIEPGGEIGWEVHEDTDQFLCLEAGYAKIVTGPREDIREQEWDVDGDYVTLVPAGTWHNVINTGEEPLKLYSIYAPPHHPAGTVHETQDSTTDAEA